MNQEIKLKNKLGIKRIEEYFQFYKLGAIWKKEIIGGISTFFAMCYILAVNPSFMLQAMGTNANQSYLAGLFLGTAIVSFLATFMMGLISKVPLCQAPGMGLNVFFTFTVAIQFKLGYASSLIVVMISGILYLIVAITPLRQKMMNAFSENFKIAIGAMIGIFVAYVGLSNMGIIEYGIFGAPSKVGTHFNNPVIIIAIISTFLLITLHFLKVPFSIVITVVLTIVMLAITYGLENTSIYNNNWTSLESAFSLNSFSDFSTFKDIQLMIWKGDVFLSTFKNPLSYIALLTFLFVNFFDATGTMYTVGKTIGIDNVDESTKGWKNWLVRANVVEGCTTFVAPIFFQSPVVSYVESNTATSIGAKTGISAIITSIMFLFSIVLWPILKPILPISQMIGGSTWELQPVTGPILVLVGVLMISQLKHFDWKSNIADVPMLLFTISFGVLGFSISNGIAWGIVSYSLINVSNLIIKIVKTKIELKRESKKESVVSIYKDLKQNDFNLTIFITSIIALVYIIVYSFIQSGIITGLN